MCSTHSFAPCTFSVRFHLPYALLMRTFIANLSIANSTTPVLVKRYQDPLPVIILRWCFLSRHGCALRVHWRWVRYFRKSRSPIHTLGIVAWSKQGNSAQHSLNTCDKYFLVQCWKRRSYRHDLSTALDCSLSSTLSFLFWRCILAKEKKLN